MRLLYGGIHPVLKLLVINVNKKYRNSIYKHPATHRICRLTMFFFQKCHKFFLELVLLTEFALGYNLTNNATS